MHLLWRVARAVCLRCDSGSKGVGHGRDGSAGSAVPPVVTTKSGNRPVFKLTVRTLLPNPLFGFHGPLRIISIQGCVGTADICTMSVTPSDETLIVTLDFEGQFDPSRSLRNTNADMKKKAYSRPNLIYFIVLCTAEGLRICGPKPSTMSSTRAVLSWYPLTGRMGSSWRRCSHPGRPTAHCSDT